MKTQSYQQPLVLKDICEIRVKKGRRGASEPRPRPQPCACQDNFPPLSEHIVQAGSPSERNPETQVSNRWLVGRYEGQRREERRQLANAKAVYRKSLLFLIYNLHAHSG